MRILSLVAGEKWTGAAAVVFDQTAALVSSGIEAQYGFVAESPLAARLQPLGWARPLLRHPRGPLDYARDVRRLRETILREKFDILHAHSSHDHYIAAFALRGSPVRLVRTIHNPRHLRRDPFTRALFRRTRAFAFANSEIAERFGAGGPVLHPIADTERFRPGGADPQLLRRFGIPQGRFLIGTIGKIARGRGHAEAIEVVSRLPARAAAIHVGHGELLTPLRKQAEVLGAGHRNFWLGYQEEALPDLYRAWDAFLFTASGSEQGQRAILEAMASGLPVVALELPGVRDLLEDGEQGFIAKDVAGLTDGVRRLLESEELRRRLGASARDRALEFTPPRFAREARRFYEDLMARW